ncbi:MAG: F0F1 ATP synthase subunit A [Pseudomonadota bacterium]
MTAGQELNATSYIQHHLSFYAQSVGDHSFWTVYVDSLVTGAVLGTVVTALMWWVVRGATSGVPNKRQAFIELLFGFVDDQVKSVFHGKRDFLAPTALTVFVWVLLMNAMDFLPADWMAGALGMLGIREFRIVPTADVNTTFALSLSVLLLVVYFSIAAKGLRGWIHELFCAPFGAHPVLWPFNFALNLVEYVSKPLSHSLRLYGNMYAGEIIFLLLWVWAATSLSGVFFGAILGVGWSIFHILIVVLQAYIFMMLTIVYISMAHESH